MFVYVLLSEVIPLSLFVFANEQIWRHFMTVVYTYLPPQKYSERVLYVVCVVEVVLLNLCSSSIGRYMPSAISHLIEFQKTHTVVIYICLCVCVFCVCVLECVLCVCVHSSSLCVCSVRHVNPCSMTHCPRNAIFAVIYCFCCVPSLSLSPPSSLT